MISVVIPTRNRGELLVKCIDAILKNSIKPDQIIIIDSSDPDKRKNVENLSNLIVQEFTDIKSAAVQRNQGINEVKTDCKYVSFLDDDVIVPENYFSKLISCIENYGFIGISGLAINVENASGFKPKNRLERYVSQIFLLDSNKNGVLLKSGVNVPVKIRGTLPVETEWLIGCSIWDFQKIKNLRFEEDFYGQSLGEDVIFSLKASSRGKIAVDPTIIINHLESSIMRPNPEEFFYMWIRNRKRIVDQMRSGFIKYLAFHWANLGKIIQIILLPNSGKYLQLKGIISGYKQIIVDKNEN
ncbi:MAG: glycosyltransferase [Actinomycetes bacterium]